MVNVKKSLPAPTSGVEHHIVTKGPPLTATSHHLDAKKLAAVKAEFFQIEEKGIVGRSNSLLGSVLHVVCRKDRSWRPCRDYRQLNLIAVRDAYPLPNMMDFTTRIAGCNFLHFRVFTGRTSSRTTHKRPAAACPATIWFNIFHGSSSDFELHSRRMVASLQWS